MSEDLWRGRVYQILYGVQFTQMLDDRAAAEMADAMVTGRYFPDGAQAYRTAIAAALADGSPLTARLDTPHSEDSFRAFLNRVAEHLDRG